MTYAPVVIPTLNRYEHFRQCLDSLERCSGADHTDVYVGLDYPPSEEYVEGWAKIDAYLKEKEKKNGFRQLVVFRRDHNCGASCSGSNRSLLGKYIRSISDRYISSEDDNVFSPNFLEYINKGLDKYENDDSILAIVGYAHPYHFKHSANNHYRHNTDMSVWGYGTWANKRREAWRYMNGQSAQIKFSLKSLFKAYQHGWLRLYQYLLFVLRKGHAGSSDSAMTAYMILTDKYVITPTLSKVRNIGWDASGNSFKNGVPKRKELIAQRHLSQPIDTAEHFDYEGDDHEFMDYNNKVAVRESDGYMSFFTFVRKLFALFNRGMGKAIQRG